MKSVNATVSVEKEGVVYVSWRREYYNFPYFYLGSYIDLQYPRLLPEFSDGRQGLGKCFWNLDSCIGLFSGRPVGVAASRCASCVYVK